MSVSLAKDTTTHLWGVTFEILGEGAPLEDSSEGKFRLAMKALEGDSGTKLVTVVVPL